MLHPDLKGYWQFFGRVDLGTTWFFHAPVPLGTTRDNFDFRRYLHAAVGEEFDVEFEHIGFWDLRVATADQYRMGRVFIAGDAAHSHPPYGGYGINTGLEDAANLGWKLAAALQGWAGADLLDSYGEERRPVFVSTARDFIEKAIQSDREFLGKFDPALDKDAFEAEWQARSSGARSEVQFVRTELRGLVDRLRVRPAPSAARSVRINSQRAPAIIWRRASSRRAAMCSRNSAPASRLLDFGAPDAAVAAIAARRRGQRRAAQAGQGRQRRRPRILPGDADPGPARSVRRLDLRWRRGGRCRRHPPRDRW